MKKVAVKLLIISLLVVLFVGCGSSSTKQIPEIVFICSTDYTYVDYSRTMYTKTFLDKNGNFYYTDNSYVCSLKYDELITEYAAGNLEGKIELRTSCDADVITEKYKELLKVVANKDYEMEYYELMPDVQSVDSNWYGIYYDKKGELDRIILHCYERDMNINSNDETANALYKWYAEMASQGKK